MKVIGHHIFHFIQESISIKENKGIFTSRLWFTSDSKNLIAFSSTSIKASASIQAISLDKTNALGPYHKDIKVQGEWYKFYQLWF